MAKATPRPRTLFDHHELGELTSGIGALVIGVGVGAIGASVLRGVGIWLVILGVLLQGWGMLERRRWILSASKAPPAWWRAIYAACWLGLAGVVAYVFAVPLR